MPRKKTKKFPLFLHTTGQWTKKIKGRFVYFGKDKEKALAKYQKEKDERQAGRNPRATADGLTVGKLCNKFLASKTLLLQSGELAPVTWRNYHDAMDRVVDFFGGGRQVLGLIPEDFEKLRAKLAKSRGVHALATQIQKVRTLFKYAFDSGLIDRPVRFGQTFQKPSRKMMRKARNEAAPRMFEADELRQIIEKAKPHLKAMVLLGINAGFGQSDAAALNFDAVDMAGRWINFPRTKTAIMRRIPLWPETLQALRDSIAERPEAKDDAYSRLVFITKYGKAWVRVRNREEGGCVPIDSVALEFNKLLKELDLKNGRAFYALRHTFRTVADTSRDTPAIDKLMGHVDESMGELYRERIDDRRLQAVVDLVRSWIWHPPLVPPAERAVTSLRNT